MKLWRNQPEHNNWRMPFSNREKAGLSFGLSVMFMVMALSELHSPRLPPFTGKYRWIYTFLYNINDNLGIFGFYILVALLFFLLGTFKWFEK